MENMNARTNEIEEITTVNEVEETSESSNAGSLIAGIVGGFLAYAFIGGAKKLKTFIDEKRARKNAEAVNPDDVTVESDEAQSDS